MNFFNNFDKIKMALFPQLKIKFEKILG
jgi:hypothetical protein